MSGIRYSVPVALLLAALSWYPMPVSSAEPGWQVELDAPEDIRPLLEQHLELFRFQNREDLDEDIVARLAARAGEDARALLATAGHFSPDIRVDSRREGAFTLLLIVVRPGPRATVASTDVRVIGAIVKESSDAGRPERLSRRWRLRPGTTFTQADWDGAKEALLRDLQLDGYPAARISASRAEVDPATAGVEIAVTVDSGPLFRYGELQIEGLERYPRALVDNLRRFYPGQSYRYEDLLRYQSALQSSGFFSSASVDIDSDPANADAATVRVLVTEYPAMKIDLGAGISTDNGPRGEASFTRYNTFRPGWQSITRLRADFKEQSLNSELALLPEPGGWRNRFGVEASRSDIEDLLIRRFGLIAQRSWRSPERELDWSLKLQTEEQAPTAGPVDNIDALTLNYSWTRRRVDDLLRPRRGHMINLQLGGASESLLSTRSFTRAYGRGLYILPLSRRDRLHLRGEAGAVFSDERKGIPSEFLFRAGGDQSVRGYDYRSLGVREGSAIVGGRLLAAATLEYQRDLTREWGAAVFIDAGNAADKRSELRPVYGYGFGVRWITPAGSLNLDLARGHETGQFRIHFTLGARF
ncbi:MAG: autotransporter assembly complex family protein [Burkholderiales bacterium]|nr:autotransporter assembly complex family protein [Burkholderiales bacterium]